MSQALATTRDAIVGHVDPATKPGQGPAAPTDLQYLTEGRRTQIVTAALSSLFDVATPAANKAVVRAGGLDICQMERPANEVFAAQLGLVRTYADLRLDRLAEILAQEADILSFFAAVLPTASPRRKATFELLTAVQAICVGLEMQVKHLCWAARPAEFAADIQPVIPTPDHSTFPSGHAAEAFAVATVLNRLASGGDSIAGLAKVGVLFRLAHRIAANRTVAGLHFPIDSAAGAMLGCAIGDAISAILSGGKLSSRSFDPAASFDDFTPSWLKGQAPASAGSPAPSAPIYLMEHWTRASAEWRTA